tara:strand:- start:301 stop:642 length:342 start_codon:yes stop_codon:yes gene_type:complete
MKINDNDFLLVLTPKQSELGWTGEVDINLKYNKSNELDDDETEAVVNLMTLMTTCVDLMEKDKGFLQQVFNHRDDLEVENELMAMDLLEDEVSVAPTIIKREGNVIKLDWSKK